MDDGGDLMLCDGLVRSVLFKSCLKGIGTAVFDIEDSSKLENIDSFMNGCDNCKSKQKQE